MSHRTRSPYERKRDDNRIYKARRRAKGMCIGSDNHGPATVGQLCRACADKANARSLRYQRKMKEEGRCAICGDDAVTSWHCRKHAMQANSYRRKGNRLNHCGHCGEKGHNVRTCYSTRRG